MTLPKGLFRRVFGLKARTRTNNRTVEEDVFDGVTVKLTRTLVFEIQREKEVGTWRTGGETQITEKETSHAVDKESRVLVDAFLPPENIERLSATVQDALSQLGGQLRWQRSGGATH